MNLEYVKSHMDGASGIRYVEIQMDDDGRAEEISDKEKRGFQRQLYQYCIEFLGPHASHCVFDVSTHEKIYDIGLLYCDAFAKEQGIDGKTYLLTVYAMVAGGSNEAINLNLIWSYLTKMPFLHHQ